MKSAYIFLLFFIFSFSLLYSNQSLANHASGLAITYSHIGGNQYLIDVILYRECSGDVPPPTLTVYISSLQCGLTDSLTLNSLFGFEITTSCPGNPSTCMGGTEPGIQKCIYENLYSFPAQCADWVLSITIPTRNAAITTIQNPAATDVYVDARLNNTIGDNTSPHHAVEFLAFICIGQTFVFNPGMIDPDGDSLVFSLIAPRTAENTNVSYIPPYSSTQPITSNPAASLDQNTGDFVSLPTTAEVGVMAYQVLEYRNGLLIGSTTFEMLVYTIPCSIAGSIDISGFDGSFDYSGAIYPGAICYDIFTYCSDPDDTLIVTCNNSSIPGSTYLITGNYHPTCTFCWTPDSADVRPQPYTFFISATSDHCPSPGMVIGSFSITVGLHHGYFSGEVFYDINVNGIKDSLENNLPGQQIKINPDNVTHFTDPAGKFFITSSVNGIREVTAIPPPNWHLTTDSISYLFPDDTLPHQDIDFGFAPDYDYNDLDVHISSLFPQCNNNVQYNLSYENYGTTIVDGRIVFVPDSNAVFITSIPTPSLISGDSLYFNFNNLYPFQSRQISLTLLLPGPGMNLDFNSSVQIDSAGNYYTKNPTSMQQEVSCFYNPNDKAVSPIGLFADHRTLYMEPLEYTIRFQNTGTNTIPTLYIQDIIDPSFDLNTFHVTGSSHTVNTTIYPDRTVEFRMENIMLPDSNVNVQASKGFIQYEILPLLNLPLPVVVENSALIFIDGQHPVSTNLVWNTLDSVLTVSIASLNTDDEKNLVIPNPFHHQAEIILSKAFANVESQFRIFNAMGKLMESRKVNASVITLKNENLENGIYLFELTNKIGQRSTGRFIIVN